MTTAKSSPPFPTMLYLNRVRAYNSDKGKLEACLKRFFCNFGHLCSYEDREEAQKLLSHSLGPTT